MGLFALQGGDWLHGVGAPNGLNARFGHAEVFDLALFNHPTTKGHTLIAARFLADLSQARPESLRLDVAGTQLNVRMEKLLVGRTYSIQASPDLTTWHELAGFSATAEVIRHRPIRAMAG